MVSFHKQLEYRMPYESPQFTTIYLHARMNFSTTYVLKPTMMVTSAQLRAYPVGVRKCYFSDEHRLRHFNYYTQTNCEIECEADFILEKCGCSMIIYDGKLHQKKNR
jgi:acid-sensing ion channel, other